MKKDLFGQVNWFPQIKVGTSNCHELCVAVVALLEQKGFASRIKGFDGQFSVYRSLCCNVDGITRVVPEGDDWMKA